MKSWVWVGVMFFGYLILRNPDYPVLETFEHNPFKREYIPLVRLEGAALKQLLEDR